MTTKQNALALEPVAAAPTPMDVLQAAISKGADISQLERLMDMQERWEKNEARKAFTNAMTRFKLNPPQIRKNKHVEFGNTKYDHASLDHVVDVVTAALSKVGISHRWSVQQTEKAISVTCHLTHEMGHSEDTTLVTLPDTSGQKNAIQAIGSAVTYLQRYTLLAATGLAAGTDDDGAAANKMPDEEIVGYQEAMEYAKDHDTLRRIFAEAYEKAKAKGDKETMAYFVRVKDKRKGEI